MPVKLKTIVIHLRKNNQIIERKTTGNSAVYPRDNYQAGIILHPVDFIDFVQIKAMGNSWLFY